MRITPIRAAAVALVLSAATASAQQASTGVQGEMLNWFDDAANKIVQLAQAIPEDKYAWRPAQGVRSVSEVLMHVTGGGYFVMGSVGIARPAGLPQNMDAVTAKAEVVRLLQQSIDAVRGAMRTMPAADLDKPTTLFGQPSTHRNVVLAATVHVHEHLGQLIAYARMNGITPPWSMQGGQ